MKKPTFLIAVTGYNCESYAERSLQSLVDQTYQNFYVEIVDDGSEDNTYAQVANFICRQGVGGFNWHYQKFTQNTGTFSARSAAIYCAEDFDFIYPSNKYDVIVLLDMDDYLLPDALETVAKEYEKGMWMTYGNYQYLSGQKNPLPIQYPDEIHTNRDYRKDVFRCTHLRTFRRELYEMIPSWELTQAEINSYPDAEILFSMMEMCGKDRIGVIDNPIYVYNNANPISTLNRFGKDVAGYDEICSRPKRDLLNLLK